MQHFDNEIAILGKACRILHVAHIGAGVDPGAMAETSSALCAAMAHNGIVAVVGRHSAHHVYIVTGKALLFVVNERDLRKIEKEV
jgi:hypothetical protein